MVQTGTVLTSRRTLLLGAAAAALAACTSKTGLDGPTAAAEDAGGGVGADPAGAVVGGVRLDDEPNPDVARVPASMVMIGDSISALSQTRLDEVLGSIGFGTVTINAESSRRIEVGEKKPTNGLDVISFIAAANRPEMWVIELGTNDAGLYASDADYQGLIDAMLDVIGADAPLVWVNTYREDHLDGCAQFNGLLQRSLDARGNATVADWYQQCITNAETILTDDGVHPNETGIAVFADTVRAAIARQLA
jgi:lysophospholipase L1-like esterase